MNTKGFSLIELLIYVSIFVATSVFMVSILIIYTQLHVRQSSVNNVNAQISFVNNAVQRLVRESSVIDMTSNVTTSTLTLRMASSTLDPTLVYLSNDTVYLKEGSYDELPLTDSKVKVNDFSVTKYENPGGHALVQIHLTISYDAQASRAKFKRTSRTAISRVSAATFDSSILPNTGGTYDIGNASQNWKDAFFSGNIGIGVSPSATWSIKTTGNIGFTTSTKGIVLMAPNGSSCFRLGVTNTGAISTSSVSCP